MSEEQEVKIARIRHGSGSGYVNISAPNIHQHNESARLQSPRPVSRGCGVHATRSSPAKMHNSHFCKEPITAGWAIKAPLSNSCGLREVEWMQRAEVVRIRQQSSKLLKYYPPNRNDSTDRNLPFSFFLAFSPSPRSSLPVPLCSAAAPEENLKIRN